MASHSFKTLVAVALTVAIVGCASKKTDDSAQVAPAPAPAPVTTPVEQPVVEPVDVAPAEPYVQEISWVGFENNPANYANDTSTRVIYFAFDRSEIPAAAYPSLRAHAQHLAANPSAKLRLEGHADERGTPEYNIALAERRGKSVQQFLVLNGAKASQLEVISYGEEKPVALGSDELSWAKNRRAELAYTAGKP